MKFVALEEARAEPGLKLVVAASLPSPWSEAAKGILHVKGIDAQLVRFSSTDKAVREWMGWHNVPALLAPGEPIRTHWTEILETAERLGAEQGSRSLVPADEDDRMRLFGLAHELLGENVCARRRADRARPLPRDRARTSFADGRGALSGHAPDCPPRLRDRRARPLQRGPAHPRIAP